MLRRASQPFIYSCLALPSECSAGSAVVGQATTGLMVLVYRGLIESYIGCLLVVVAFHLGKAILLQIESLPPGLTSA